MTTDTPPILRPARLFAKSIEPGYLRLDTDAIEGLAKELALQTPEHWLLSLWQAPDLSRLQSLTAPDLTLFLTIFHTIGFCYWPAPRWTYQHDDTTYDGSAALIRSLYDLCVVQSNERNQDNTVKIDINKLHQSVESPSSFAAALGGKNTLPLLDERHRHLKKLLDMVTTDLIERLLSKEDALTKAFYVSTLPGFDDTARPQGFEPIPFLKRAQLLTSDIDFVLRSVSAKSPQKPGHAGLAQMDQLTAFADYKLPQILRHSGALIYGQELTNLVDNQIELAAVSQAELAIRVFTLLAIEHLRLLTPGKTASQIDSILWTISQTADKDKMSPYHRTISCNY